MSPRAHSPPKLRWLILTDNAIETLPNSLGERPRLQKLALAGNQLTELPATMAQLSNLELLRISANNITHFPTQLLCLPKLAWFAFAGNPFSQINTSNQSVPVVTSSDFTLHEVLGKGASGIISRATWNTPQVNLPSDIAVKVFKGEITSDGYPNDELQACLKVGNHPNLIQSLAQVSQGDYLALVMNLIPDHYRNLGLPPCFDSCTRDRFPDGFTLSIKQIVKIVNQISDVFEYIHENKVCHGDLYAHNTLYDTQANIIFGDFGAATMYHMLNESQQQQIKKIEGRALNYFIDDLLQVCEEQDKQSSDYQQLLHRVNGYQQQPVAV